MKLYHVNKQLFTECTHDGDSSSDSFYFRDIKLNVTISPSAIEKVCDVAMECFGQCLIRAVPGFCCLYELSMIPVDDTDSICTSLHC